MTAFSETEIHNSEFFLFRESSKKGSKDRAPPGAQASQTYA
jgi:hypothetical protein